jgi:hypothetical protein
MADKKPLHLLMRDAYTKAVQTSPGRRADGEAAMLRALADEVAPESEVPSDHEIGTYGLHIAWVRWDAMHSFRQRLLKGAAEAEGKS